MLAHPAFIRPSHEEFLLRTRGLVALWPLDDVGTGTCRDLVGGGGRGTVAGTISRSEAIAARSGAGSARFTGVAGTKVSGTGTGLPNSSSTDEWTIFGWVLCTAAPTQTAHFFGFGADAEGNPANGTERRIGRYSGKIQAIGWGSGGTTDFAGSVDVDINKPMLLAYSRTSANARVLSLNGVSIGSSNNRDYSNAGGQNWQVAAKFNAVAAGAELTNTRIQFFGISRAPLSMGELRDIYSDGMG